jgi:DNA-binding CsgD family transcriptional regulator
MYTHNLAVSLGATAVWELEAVDLAPIYYELALQLVAAGVGEPPLCSHHLAAARMAALRRDLPAASTLFERSRKTLDESGQRPLRAIVDLDEALALDRLASTDRSKLRNLVDAATAAFETLGMHPWLERAQQLSRPGPKQDYPDRLTAREVEVLRLVAGGLTNKEMAERLVLSVPTIHRHIANIYAKIGARGRADATAYTLNHDLADGPAGRTPFGP